jgi:hypothetical protein
VKEWFNGAADGAAGSLRRWKENRGSRGLEAPEGRCWACETAVGRACTMRSRWKLKRRSSSCLARRRRRKRMVPRTRRARRTIPPMTPPAIAAALMWGGDFVVEEGECEAFAVGEIVELAVLEAVVEVGTGATVEE